jgi:hypothetical protein
MKSVWFGCGLALILMAGPLSGCMEAGGHRGFDPRADAALRKMSAAVGGARSFSFHSVTTMDEPIATGQLAQFSRENHIVVRRPDRIAAEGRQDEDALFLWYEGRNLTVLDKTAKLYATLDVPNRIDAMLKEVAVQHRLTLPMADLLFSDPYRVLTANAYTGRYVGLEKIAGVECHHVLFTQENLDWQMWIDAVGAPVPRKFVIDYKSMPERPQFSAVLSDWRLSAATPAEQFKPIIPPDAKKVDISHVLAAGKGE